jgi:hypothetical protein
VTGNVRLLYDPYSAPPVRRGGRRPPGANRPCLSEPEAGSESVEGRETCGRQSGGVRRPAPSASV